MSASPDLPQIVQTTRAGDRLKPVPAAWGDSGSPAMRVDPAVGFQTVEGIGGSFTESSAHCLSELSQGKQEALLQAYFSPDGAGYSLTRTHIASCDFSLKNYTYAPVPGDTELRHFSIEPDRAYLLPMIKAAQAVAGAEFKILASPWTAPPWMKDNGHWNGGALLPGHYATFAAYIVRYLQAYAEEGIGIWGITPMNEPLGNNSNWESTHFTAAQMRDWIAGYLGPALKAAGLSTGIWAYDQNRDAHLKEWAYTLMGDPEAAAYLQGMAVHWYQSTRDAGEVVLDEVAAQHPDLRILHSEGCIDAIGDDEPVGSWLEDDWYWREEATDWGWFWAPEEDKPDHPKYSPFCRYARDLVRGFNHGLVGWIDWNLILNTRGGPNHARNFCLAPVLTDSGHDDFYLTPLYYAVAHFSKYVRPGAVRVALREVPQPLEAVAFRNPDGSLAVILFNESGEEVATALQTEAGIVKLTVPKQSLLTVIFPAS